MNPSNCLVDHQRFLPILDNYTTHWYGCSQHATLNIEKFNSLVEISQNVTSQFTTTCDL